MTTDEANTSEPKWQQAWRAIVTAESDVALAMENAGICKQFKDRNQCPCSKLDATSDPLNELWDECARLAARVQEQANELIDLRVTLDTVKELHAMTIKERDDARRALVQMGFPPIKGPDGDFVYQQVAAARAAMKGETNG